MPLRDRGSDSDTTLCTWVVTQTPLVPSGPFRWGLTVLPRRLLRCSSCPVHGDTDVPRMKREERRPGQGLGAIPWPPAPCEKVSSLLCSGAMLCRLLSCLFKAVASSLQAHQTCKKSHRCVSKYNHRHPILGAQVWDVGCWISVNTSPTHRPWRTVLMNSLSGPNGYFPNCLPSVPRECKCPSTREVRNVLSP